MSGNRRLSQLLAHALRHEPWVYELEIDAEGWTPLEAVLQALNQRPRWATVTRTELEALVANQTKQRYEIAAGRIRALYGHSLQAKILKTPADPPILLYHGTAPASVPLILREGLKPMGRQYVHLSVTVEVAEEVGRRKAPTPTILEVFAAEAQHAGVVFYAGHDLIWLADVVPPAYIRPIQAAHLNPGEPA